MNAPIDDAVLQVLSGPLRTDNRVTDVVLVPGENDGKHKHLAVTLDATRYPEHIEHVRLEFQWYKHDGFNAHYRETHTESDWQCRWDRHSSGHSSREQFHPPPNAGTPTDTTFPSDYRDVLSMILVVIQDRIEVLWQEYSTG